MTDTQPVPVDADGIPVDICGFDDDLIADWRRAIRAGEATFPGNCTMCVDSGPHGDRNPGAGHDIEALCLDCRSAIGECRREDEAQG